MNPIEYNTKLNDLYLNYNEMVFRIALVSVTNVEDAKDILQEVFIRLMKKGLDFVDEKHEKRWLIHVTKNVCRDYYKSTWFKRTSFSDIESLYYLNEHQDFNVLESIMKLKQKYKMVILLYFYEGYKIQEISDILKEKESTVKMRLKKAKEILKIEMEESV